MSIDLQPPPRDELGKGMETTRGGPLSFLPKGILRWVILAVIVWVFFVPIVRLVILSFSTDVFPTVSNYIEVLSEARTWRTIENTAIVAVAGTVISLVFGTALAWLVSYSDIRFKGLVHALVMLPFILPGYLYTIAWVEFVGPGSWPTRLVGLLPGLDASEVTLFGLPGIAFILGLRHMPLVYLLTVGVLRGIPRQLEQAGRVSGAGPLTVFRRVTFPMALPGIVAGGVLALLSNLDNFGIPAVLGIPAGISVLSTLIYEEVVSFGPVAFARAAVLSVILGLLALTGVGIQQLLLRRSKVSDTRTEDREPRFSLRWGRIPVEGVLVGVLFVLSILPLISMAMSSLSSALGVPVTWDTISFENYRIAILDNEGTLRALRNSFQLALGAAAVGLVIATGVAYQRTRRGDWISQLMDSAISLPFALPGLVLALAMIFAWLQPIPGVSWNPGLYGTAGIILIAYIVRFTYYQLRAMVTGFLQVDPKMEEAARISGVGRFHTWRRIMIPLLLPAVVSGTALVIFVALTELTVSSLLWSSGAETIGVRVYGFRAAGYSRYAAALSSTIVIGLLLSMGIITLFTRVWRRRTHTETNIGGRP